jgi:single-strand DNA-binding protein
MNVVVILGRTTSEIELKQTNSGKMVVSVSLAVKRPYVKDTVDFYNITAWDKLAETLSKYVAKGTLICIRGYLQTRSWEDAEGHKHYATEIVAQDFSFCEPKASSEGNSLPQSTNGSQGKNSGSQAYIPEAYKQPKYEDAAMDADLPF